MPDNKQSPTFRGPATQTGTGRQEIGTIPSAASQKNWSYAMVRDKGDKRILRLDGGKGRSFAFRFDSGLSKDDVAAGRPVTVTRLGDSVPHDPDGSEVMSKGSVQVHKSSPTLIHATFHDGKGGSTLMFEQGQDGGWSVKPGKKRSLADMTARFVSVMGKQAGLSPTQPNTSAFGRYLASKNLDFSIAQNKRQIMDEIDPDGTLQDSQTLLDLESYKKQRQLGYDFMKKTLRRQSSGSVLNNALVYGALGGVAGAVRGALSGYAAKEGPGLRAAIGGGIGLTAGALLGSLGRLWNKYEESKITDEDVARMKEQQKDRSLASDLVPGLDIYDAVMADPKKDAGRLAKLSQPFASLQSKQASVCCPCCGVTPGKYKIQGDAISCGDCGKTSDMEKWDKTALDLVHYSRDEHPELRPLSYDELVKDRTSGRWEDKPELAEQYVQDRKRFESALHQRLTRKGIDNDPNSSFLYATIGGREKFYDGLEGYKHVAPLSDDIIARSFFDVAGDGKSRTVMGPRGLAAALRRWDMADASGKLQNQEYMGMTIRPRIEVITPSSLTPTEITPVEAKEAIYKFADGSSLLMGAGLGGLAGGLYGALTGERGDRYDKMVRWGLRGTVAGGLLGGASHLMASRGTDSPFSPPADPKETAKFDALRRDRNYAAKDIMDKGETSPRQINDIQFGPGDLDRRIAAASAYRARHPELKYLQKLDKFDQKVPIKPATLPEGNYGVTTFSYPSGVLDRLAGVFSRVKPKELPEKVEVSIDVPQVAAARASGIDEGIDLFDVMAHEVKGHVPQQNTTEDQQAAYPWTASLKSLSARGNDVAESLRYLLKPSELERSIQASRDWYRDSFSKIPDSLEEVMGALNREYEKGSRSVNPPSSDALRLRYMQRATTPSDWSKIMNQATQLFPGVVTNGGTTSKVAIEGAILEQPNAMTSANIARHEGAQKPIRSFQGVDSLGGPGAWPTPAPGARKGMRRGKLPTGNTSTATTPQPRFISTTPLKSLNSAMPAITQLMKTAAGTWRRPENFDQLSDNGLNDTSYVVYVGANDWECGVTWAAVYRQKDVNQSGVSGATPRVWVEIDHDNCPGCEGSEYSPGGTVGKNKCNDFGRKVVRRWVRESMQGGSGSLEDRLYAAARMDSDVKSYGRAAQKSASLEHALQGGLLGAGAGGLIQYLRGSSQDREGRKPSVLNGMLLGGLAGAAAGGLMPGKQSAAAPAPPASAPLSDAQINEILSGSHALAESQYTYRTHVTHNKNFAANVKELGNGTDMNSRGGTVMVPGVWNASDAVPAPKPLHGYQYTVAPFTRGAEPSGSAILAHSPQGAAYLSLLNDTKGGLIGMSATPTWEVNSQNASALRTLFQRGNISMDDLSQFSPEKMPGNKLINGFQRPIVPPPAPPVQPPMVKSGAHRCPFCGSDDTYTRTAHEETEMEERQVRCKMCHKSAPLDECMATKTAGVGSYLKILRDKFVAARDRVHLTPTPAQRESGSYRKGHVWVNGLDLVIENPKGSTRSGVDQKGKKWSTVMKDDYGYIRRFKNEKGEWVSCRVESDGDHLDMFMGPHPDSESAFVVDQNNPLTGAFDEAKVMLGFKSIKDAKKAYIANFSDGWKGFRSITHVTLDELCHWVEHGDTAKPYSTPKTWKAAAAGVPDLAANEGAVLQSQKQGVQVVRGSGDQSVRSLASQFPGFLGRYVSKTAGHDLGAEGRESGLLQGKLLLGHPHRAESKQAEQCSLQLPRQKSAASGAGGNDGHPQGHAQDATGRFGVDARKGGDNSSRSSAQNLKNADLSGGHIANGFDGQTSGGGGMQIQKRDPSWIIRSGNSVQKCASAPDLTGELVFVFDEYSGDKFLGHSFVSGCHTVRMAKEAHVLAGGEQKTGEAVVLTNRQFKQWLDDGDTSKPLVGQSLHKIIKKTAVVDNSYLPPVIASAFDSPMVKNPALAVGSGALRGATIAALIHGLRTMKRETLDEPKKDLNLTRDLGLGAAIGAGSGALLHYAPEITSFVHEAFNPSMPKEAHIMDIPMLPFSVAAPAAPLVGAAYGSILGGLKGMATRLKKKITGEPEEEGEVEDSILNGVQGGLNIGVSAAMGGRNVHTDKLTGIAPPPVPPAGVRGKGKVPPRPAKPVATPSINRYVIPRTR